MNREQNLKGHKNVICCIFSVVILIVLLFPLYWTLVTSLKTEQEIFQIPAHSLAERSEYEILYRAARSWRFQYVPFFWKQPSDFAGRYGHQRCAGGSGILRDCQI